MIPAWLLAVLVVGVGFPVGTALGVLLRDRQRGSLLVARGEPVLGEVAVVIAARDAEGEIVAAIEAAAKLVPRTDIHVVSDESTDRTVDVAHDHGVNVAETLRPAGRAGAVAAALTGFQALDRYRYVLVLDVDHRPHPQFLDRTLPLFDDSDVAAVSGYAQTDWDSARRGFVGRLLTAYRARAYALTQWLLTVNRTRPRVEAGRLLPSPARMYRSSVLAALDADPQGLVVADFDLSNQIYRRGLGRVVVVRGAVVGTRDPDNLRTYARQVRLWTRGFWQAARRDGRGGPHTAGLVAFAVENVLTSVALLAVPVLAAFGLITVPALLLGVFLPDLLLTLIVAARQRESRYLPIAVFFPFMRLFDAVLHLGALVGRVPARWLSPVRPLSVRSASTRVPWWRTKPVAAVGWLLAAASGAALAVRVAMVSATLPVSVAENAIVDAVYGGVTGQDVPSVPSGLVFPDLQMVLYAGISRAFERYSSVLISAREVSVAAVGVAALCLVLIALLLRVRPLAAAVALAAAAVCVPVVAAFATAGPGPLGAAWLGVAGVSAAAAVRKKDPKLLTIAVIALPVAVATVPLVLLPVAVGGLVWSVLARKWVWTGVLGVVALAGAALIALDVLAVPSSVVLGADLRDLLLIGCLLAGAGGLLVGRARPVAAGLLTAALLSLAGGVATDALVPVSLACAVLVVAILADELATRIPDGAPALARRAGVALAAIAALAGAGWGVRVGTPVTPSADHRAAVDWFTAAAASTTDLSAPPLLWSDLRRDLARAGQPANRAHLGGVTTLAANGTGLPLARFPGITITLTDGGAGYVADGNRNAAGGQLAANDRIEMPDTVRAALRAGQVDMRVMAVLAEISAQHDLTLAEVSNPAPEAGSELPLRTAVLSEVDGAPATDPAVVTALKTWLAAQLPPYAPDDSRVTDRGFALSWRMPAPGAPVPK
ncbi:glycosyltransferase family 2 protein [Actinokineospora sp. NBRC 105648]|uniref:glycosyltransferase n=1 Tax=Actinokineospora sp. NBRC 105648 TaxID=3032206 RepID=UPI0024A450D4|nr:glycosyltransferase family 2 protein [Actinokineospora sp. NBRC 105648]GLZ43000.1 hypothetical protein Acsp05_66240 [Actinokineospora sp. NBRC 105648]